MILPPLRKASSHSQADFNVETETEIRQTAISYMHNFLDL